MDDNRAFIRRNIWLARLVGLLLVALLARYLFAGLFDLAAIPGVAFWMLSPVLVVVAVFALTSFGRR